MDFTVETSIDLREGQLLIKFSKISKPTNLKKESNLFFLASKRPNLATLVNSSNRHTHRHGHTHTHTQCLKNRGEEDILC